MPRGKRSARRRSDKPDRSQAEAQPRSAADQLRAALNELAEPPRDRRLMRHKQRHVDDYRETALDGQDYTPPPPLPRHRTPGSRRNRPNL